jgi:hypothetical protein
MQSLTTFSRPRISKNMCRTQRWGRYFGQATTSTVRKWHSWRAQQSTTCMVSLKVCTCLHVRICTWLWVCLAPGILKHFVFKWIVFPNIYACRMCVFRDPPEATPEAHYRCFLVRYTYLHRVKHMYIDNLGFSVIGLSLTGWIV